MNFVKYERTIQSLLPAGTGGCYIYSQSKNDRVFKIGTAWGDLFDRIRRQKFCYPYKNEYFLHYIWVTSTTREDVYRRKKATTLERSLLNYVGKKVKGTRNQYKLTASTIIDDDDDDDEKEQGRRPLEFRFVGSKERLKKLIQDVFMTTPLWSKMIEFRPRTWDVSYAFQYGLQPIQDGDLESQKTTTRSGRISKKPDNTYVNAALKRQFDVDVRRWERENKLSINNENE